MILEGPYPPVAKPAFLELWPFVFFLISPRRVGEGNMHGPWPDAGHHFARHGPQLAGAITGLLEGHVSYRPQSAVGPVTADGQPEQPALVAILINDQSESTTVLENRRTGDISYPNRNQSVQRPNSFCQANASQFLPLFLPLSVAGGTTFVGMEWRFMTVKSGVDKFSNPFILLSFFDASSVFWQRPA